MSLRHEAAWLERLSGRLIDHGHGLLDVTLASYNHFVRTELPRMVNDMRAIVWSERSGTGAALSVVIQMKFASAQRPMLTESQPQILLPLQAQQLCKSYNGRLLVNIEIHVRVTTPSAEGGDAPPVVTMHEADIRDLCVGEIPALVGSCLCHQPLPPGARQTGGLCYFIVNGQSKVIVSQERLCYSLLVKCSFEWAGVVLAYRRM
jgi:DNA-directed RNA polymerase beta subunit